MQSAVTLLAAEYAADSDVGATPPAWSVPPDIPSVDAYALWLMDRDRKSPGLKELQGLIWKRGYRAGDLRGELFPDVPPAFTRWRARGLRIAIYSSGSVLAQRLLFSTTPFGDLTSAIDAFFDTGVGAKVQRESYTRIAAALGARPDAILFVSDVLAELYAARDAGLRPALSVRPGNTPTADVGAIPVVRSFEELT